MRVCRPNPAPLPLGREGDLEHTDATTHAVGVACGRWFALSCSARCSTISHFHCPGALVIQAFPSTHITQRPPDGRQMGATDRWDFGHVLMCMTRPVMFRCPFPHSPTPYISFCPQHSRWACCKATMGMPYTSHELAHPNCSSSQLLPNHQPACHVTPTLAH